MSRNDHAWAKRALSFAANRDATSAIEFAIVLPVLALFVFGGYQMNEAVSAYRKVTLTNRTVADLTTQYTSMASSDVTTVLNASAQVMAPFDTANLTIVLTEFATDSSGKTTVTWSKSLNGTPLVVGSTVTLPANVAQLGTSLVLAQTTFNFTPAIVYNAAGPFVLSSQIYMSPRSTQSITYTGT